MTPTACSAGLDRSRIHPRRAAWLLLWSAGIACVAWIDAPAAPGERENRGDLDPSARATPASSADTLVVPLHLSAPPESLRLGDRFDLEATIPSPDLHALTLLTPAAALEPFELAGWRRQLDRGDTASVRITLQVFAVGSLVLPPLVVAGETAHDGVCFALSESLAVNVLSIVPQDATELRDIHEAIEPDRPRSRWPWFAALAACALGAIVYVLLRRRRREMPGEHVTAARPAHEIALDALAALEGAGLAATGPWKRYYTELTEILRRYVSRRHGVDAMDMTTNETMRALKNMDLDEAARHALRSVLAAADEVKFAKGEPEGEEAARHLEAAKRFVRLSAPREAREPARGPLALAGEGPT